MAWVTRTPLEVGFRRIQQETRGWEESAVRVLSPERRTAMGQP